MYLLFMPQFRAQKKHKKLLESLNKGQKVLTNGGLVGWIVNPKKEGGFVTIRIADRVEVDVTTSAIVSVIEDPAKKVAEKSEKTESK
jgi:preprotein translocase subunit YajC